MQNSSMPQVSNSVNLVSVLSSSALQMASALMLAVVVIYGAGFLQTSVAHNAAHDMRHASGFPCH